MKKSEVELIVKNNALPIADELNFELVDVEYIKEGPYMYLKIYIDKVGGVTIEDCQKMSGKINEKLNEIDPIEENYFLEVSSPGLDRPLKTDKDLMKNMNNDIEISLYKSIDGKKKYKGELINFDENEIEIKDEKNVHFKLDRDVISKINLAFKF